MKIAMIIPEDLIESANKAAAKFEESITIFNGTMNEGITIAKDLETQGYDCIIARGGTKILLSNIGLKIPTISVPITNVDIFEAISEAEKIDDDVTIMAFNNMMPASDSYTKISGKSLRIIQVSDENEVKEKLRELADDNKKVVVGGGIINNFAKLYNITPIVIKSGEEAFTSAIKEAIGIAQATRNEKEAKERIRAIIENTKDGIVCINHEGIINIVNKSAEEMLKIKYNDILFKKAKDVLPELELEETIESGLEETGIIKSIRGTKFIISKIPIKINEETVDVVAILMDIDEIHKLEEKIRQDIASSGHFTRYNFKDVLGVSSKIKEVVRIGKEYAKVSSTVLIEGETGTGKEVIAQSIHNDSVRANRAFVAVNCAAIPENLLESELFGYAAGAFTGADKKGKRGLFEIAQEGTIFLDEISEMNPMLQGRLLRVLQEKQIMRIGDHKLIPIDVRIIAASNRNIYKLVKEGKFREDLYYRLNILKMVLSPIRDRKEDILYFLDGFIKMYCDRLGKEIIRLDNDAKKYLLQYNWPGNVREIRNFSERLSVMSKKQIISLEDIQNQIFHLEVDNNIDIHKSSINVNEFEENSINLDNLEKKAIKDAIKKMDGNISKAAVKLGISRTTIWRKMKKYNIIVSK